MSFLRLDHNLKITWKCQILDAINNFWILSEKRSQVKTYLKTKRLSHMYIVSTHRWIWTRSIVFGHDNNSQANK